MNNVTPLQLHLATETETRKLAEELSLFLRSGMVVLLKGNLGAGKSTFARALIRALSNSKGAFDIPSPSFSLVQMYDFTRVPVAHVDLYRTEGDLEVNELGLADLLGSHLLVIEWPNEIAENLGAARLFLEFSGTGSSRDVEITGEGACNGLLTRLFEIRNFISRIGWDEATRTFLDGDASSRRYERLQKAEANAVLMDMPSKPDGPPVKDGKPYSNIAHLAEGLRSVVAINDLLVTRGFGAPQILARDIEQGLALIEDFGDNVFGRLRACGQPMREPMDAAVEVLANIAAQDWTEQIQMRDQSRYIMNAYDIETQLIEVDLLTSWFFNHAKSNFLTENQVSEFHNLWSKILKKTHPAKLVLVLRDFHSPNLIWRPEQTGLKRVGLIDTQDAVLGHPAYDLVSLLQDARIDIPVEEEKQLYSNYSELRQKSATFDPDEFGQAYAILGAQRATKILGIFARLAKRDGKSGYLQHLPRVSRYLERNLHHPVLSELRKWIETNLPEAIEGAK